jgi:hypothetical protein
VRSWTNFDGLFISVGIGRSVTMKFSELGYTVFALCPNRLHNTPSMETRPSDVSSASVTQSVI